MNACIYKTILWTVSERHIKEWSSERSWTKRGKIIDAGRKISYVLNSGVTELNLTKCLHSVQKWLLIKVLKSKLRYSTPLQNTSMPNKQLSSNLSRVAAQFSLSTPL